jgi:hypothetical protein
VDKHEAKDGLIYILRCYIINLIILFNIEDWVSVNYPSLTPTGSNVFSYIGGLHYDPIGSNVILILQIYLENIRPH